MPHASAAGGRKIGAQPNMSGGRLATARRWRTRALAALVLAALALPLPARADGSDQPPAKNERVITLGPQAVVIVNERGQPRMYDEPSQRETACKSPLACLAEALGAYALVGVLAGGNVNVFRFDARVASPPRVPSLE